MQSPRDGAALYDDHALVEALVAGRPEAFEAFVDRFGPPLLRFGTRMCGARDDADEVLQETLLKVFVSLKNLRDPRALRTWVYRVAANACLKMRPRGGARPHREIPLEEILSDADGGGTKAVADWSGIPLKRLLQGELKKSLEREILALPKAYRIALLLRDQEGLSTRETARALGIGESLVKVRLHRARLALRKALSGYLA